MKIFLFIIILVSVLAFIPLSSALLFNGTVYNVSGSALEGALVNITIRNTQGFSINHSNWTYTNSTGGFNITLSENANWLYEPAITHNTSASGRIFTDYVGQSLPAFPAFIFQSLSGTSFYLRQAGTLNITAINETNARVSFNYQVKDTKLGYPIAFNMDQTSRVSEINLVVPLDRNYSVVIYPQNSIPVSFNWNNFSSTQSHVVGSPSAGTNISIYNATTKTLHKQFNTTIQMVRVYGFANVSGATAFVPGWNELTIVPFILEAGNNVHVRHGAMPYNMSSFLGESDNHTLGTGFYNISLPAPAESASYLLFATGRNGTKYYGGFSLANLTYGVTPNQTNVTMSGLLGIPANITVDNAADFSRNVNISTAKQVFQLINTSNQSLSNVDAHVEVSVDYTSQGGVPLTWVEFINQGSSTNFSIPLFNNSNVQEINIFIGGGNYAPKRISPSASSLITNNNDNGNRSNITIGSFNPGAIDSVLQASQISMNLYISNSTCDIPNPASGCLVGGSSSMSDFNPMGAIMGGGKLSFRMGTGNILIHYVNVDMIASGPPDALFDSSTTERSGGNSFDNAVRFGSGGPTVYDYVLVSMPYTESAGSGLDDSQPVNISIPLMYDDNWNVIWNNTANGSNVGAFATNFSHYKPRQNEWAYLMNQTICTTTESSLNSTTPCYIDITNNRVWVRLPHFSGTGPSVGGKVKLVAASSSSTSSGESGGGTISSWINTQKVTASQFSSGFEKNLEIRNRITFDFENETHHVGVKKITSSNATLEIASTPLKVIFLIGESKKFDLTGDGYYDLLVTLKGISALQARVFVQKIYEVAPSAASDVATSNTTEVYDFSAEGEAPSQSRTFLYIFMAVIVILIIVAIIYKQRGNYGRKYWDFS